MFTKLEKKEWRPWTGHDQMLAEMSSAERTDYRMAHRSSVPVAEFNVRYDCGPGGDLYNAEVVETCPVCGSLEVESEVIDDYGGTSSGYSRCGFCGYSTHWADLSAVI